jgi:hypothetical protein
LFKQQVIFHRPEAGATNKKFLGWGEVKPIFVFRDFAEKSHKGK